MLEWFGIVISLMTDSIEINSDRVNLFTPNDTLPMYDSACTQIRDLLSFLMFPLPFV